MHRIKVTQEHLFVVFGSVGILHLHGFGLVGILHYSYALKYVAAILHFTFLSPHPRPLAWH